MISISQFSRHEIHFPQQEWKTLRLRNEYSPFFWGAHYRGQLWVWDFSGSTLYQEVTEDLSRFTKPILILNSPEETYELNLFNLYLSTAFLTQKPSDIEWVWALKLLRERFLYSLTESGISDAIALALEANGYEAHFGVLAGKERFHFFSDDEIQFCFSKNWDPAVFELLETLDIEVRLSLVRAIKKYEISAQNARDAISHVLILTKKIGVTAPLGILQAEHKSQHDLLMGLYRLAQPEMYRLSQDRIDRLRELKPPIRTSVFADPSFENDSLKITHQPKNLSDLSQFIEWINHEEIHEKFKKLFDVYKQ